MSGWSYDPLGIAQCTIWLFNIAIENGPFIDDFPIKTSIYKGFSMAMLNNQRVGENPAGFWSTALAQQLGTHTRLATFVVGMQDTSMSGAQPNASPQGIPIAPASECVRNKKSLANFDFFCVSQKLGYSRYSRYSRYSSIAIIYGHLNIENNDWLRVPHLTQTHLLVFLPPALKAKISTKWSPQNIIWCFSPSIPAPNIKYSPKNPKSYGLAIDLFMFGAPQIAGIS